MRRARGKLKGTRGISLLLAISIFLLCALAGASALTAAATNSGRLTHMEYDQQKYLSTASAAELLRGNVLFESFEVSYTRKELSVWWYKEDGGVLTLKHADTPKYSMFWGQDTVNQCYGVPGAPSTGTGVKIHEGTADPSKLCEGSIAKKCVDDLLQYSIAKVPPEWWSAVLGTPPASGSMPSDMADYYNGKSSVAEKELTFTVKGDGNHGLGEVKVDLTLNTDFSIDADLYFLGDDGVNDHEYKMSLKLNALVDTVVKTNSVQGRLDRSEFATYDVPPSGVDSAGYDDVTMTITIKVTWPDDMAVISDDRD